MVVPGDAAGGRYVSNLVELEVFTATVAVPESSTWALLVLGFAGIGFAGWRRATLSVA